jgi:transposase
MKLFGAIDLHSNNNVTVLIDERDEVVYRKRLPNDLTLIIEQLSPYQSTLEGIVVESTYNWYWLVDGLMKLSRACYYVMRDEVLFDVARAFA